MSQPPALNRFISRVSADKNICACDLAHDLSENFTCKNVHALWPP